MPAKYVRPYSKGQKNDFRDAEAIAEASQAQKSRPFENTAPLPIAATIALEMIGPMPGTVISRSHAGS
jgi:transposase